MSLDWKSVNDLQPKMGVRVLARSTDGWGVARLTNSGWHHTNGLPFFNVTHWTFVDGPDGERLA